MREESTYIKRLSKSENDFDVLKKRGIEMIQELSGKIWTDYNLHDPGVTILEQLCYVLSELNYLANFEVKDFLTTEDEGIKFKELALYQPLEIFPSEIVTQNDYCKAILNNIDGIRSIWIEEDESNHKQGLYRFVLDVSLEYQDKQELISNFVKQFFNANRNLCEDIESIEFYHRKPIELAGIIEINGERTPNEILAQILFECFKIISPRTVLHSYQKMIDSEISLEDILSGPELSKGYIKDEDLIIPDQCLSVSQIMKEIFAIKGVDSIVDLHLEIEACKFINEYRFSNSRSGGYLKIPSHTKELKISLMRNNRAATIDMQQVYLIFHQLHTQYKSSYNTSKEIANLFEMPVGKYVNFETYFSIQNHFPDVYGINHYGIPRTAKPERKAKAKQLKAYLLLFEQIVANYLSQLENVKNLFTIKDRLDPTYYTQTLHAVPNSKELFDDDLQSSEDLHRKRLETILSKYDDVYDRRNRLVDYVLAMYGESFHQTTFQEFNYYYSSEELRQVLYQNKVFWLKNIIELNRYKARSFNYLKTYSNHDNVEMVKWKVSLLLGIENQINLPTRFKNAELKINKWSCKMEIALLKSKYPDINLDVKHLDAHFSIVKSSDKLFQVLELDDTFDQVLFANEGEICEEFFRYGINLDQYRIGKLEGHKYYILAFKSEKSGEYLYLRKCKEKDTGIELAMSLQKQLIKLNQQCEGVHIVEHILLRSENKTSKYIGVADEFYPFRISVILPNWSARFNNPRFRSYLEETFHLNLPAHVYPEFYWLDSSKMKLFEEIHGPWLNYKRQNESENTDKYSQKIIQFLCDNKPEKS